MSVIDDNKMKLLKMKEKLISLNNSDTTILDDYKKVACDIDMDLYTSITDKIDNNKDYVNYPLEKQLEFLVDLEEDFSEYYKFQKNVIMICNRYFVQGFDLTDSSLIRIGEIRKRISSINKYLNNEKEIEKNRIELDKLNSDYISEEQRANMFEDRVSSLDYELRNNILKAEGRKTTSDGNIEYVSVVTEAESLGINLKHILDDNSLLEEEVLKAETLVDEANERLKSAQICYENNLNASYKDIYFNIRKETISFKYRLMFLKIIQLIGSNNTTYKQANRKRTELTYLIKDRIKLLEQLGIRYLYDPFDRIGLKEQLDIIKAYGNNYDRIKNIRKKIDEISNDNDKRILENRNYSDYFKINIELFGSDVAVISSNVSVPEEVIDNFYSHNKVIKVNNPQVDFKLDRAHEKTSEVIKRIYGVINDKEERNKPYDVSPSLVIESDNDIQIFDNFDSEMDEDDDLVATDSSDNIFIEDNDLVGDEPTDNMFSQVTPFDEVQPFEMGNEPSTTSITEDLFQDVQPFEEPQLFDDRYDEGNVFETQAPVATDSVVVDTIPEQNVSMPEQMTPVDNISTRQNIEMPDVFWETSNEPVVDDNQGVMSFDDQIAALINSEDDAKVKKLVS